MTASMSEKVVVFSHYIQHLVFLQRVLRETCGISPGLLSGSCSDSERRGLLVNFQIDPSCRVLFASVRVGGVGINLSVANHCILLDVGWNPTDDTQATYRVYRLGQSLPVMIYRLATYGTSEHIVFSYALQKSWLHKKVADVTDPTRRERHMKNSYYTYPCTLPLPDDAQLRKFTAAERSEYLFSLCHRESPYIAQALEASVVLNLRESLYTVIPHSFLLRDNDDEVVREVGRRLTLERLELESLVPIPLMFDEDMSHNLTKIGSSSSNLVDLCEEKLVEVAKKASNHCVWYVLRLQRQNGWQAAGLGKDAESEAISEIDGAELHRQLVCALFPFVTNRQTEADYSSTTTLVEVLLGMYQKGVYNALSHHLSTSPYLRMRTYLASLIPPLGFNSHSTMVKGLLEDKLLYQPFELLKAVSEIEQMYLATEMGYTRPLVPECFLEGTLTCIHAGISSRHRTHIDALKTLANLLKVPLPSKCDDDGIDENYLQQIRDNVMNELRRCFNDMWPSCSGFVLPPLVLDVRAEERLMLLAYNAADQDAGGLFTISEAAEYLQLRTYKSSKTANKMYVCNRCQKTYLQRSSDTVFECALCHYNIEFEIKNNISCQHRATLYQWSVVCNWLDAFSITKSFSVSFSPANCTSVWDVLFHLHGPHPVFHYIQRCMKEGVDALLTDFPDRCIQLLSLQSGTGDDRELLRRVLCCGARMVWGKSLRKHLRDALSGCFRELVEPSSLRSLTSMPLMCLVLALCHAARCEELNFAAELLTDDGTEWCGRRALLRFACDSLVKILYAEKLLTHCCDAPNVATVAPSLTVSASSSPSLSLGSPSDSLDPISDSRNLSPTSSLYHSKNSNDSEDSTWPLRKRQKGTTEVGASSVERDTQLSLSSFGSRYSSERDSFPDSPKKIENKTCGEHGKEEKVTEQLESEVVLQQRSAQYWVAFCEVYGTELVDTLNVYLEDKELGTVPLSSPPPYFWVSHLLKASRQGSTITTVISSFLAKMLELSVNVRLIK